jgi:DNA (cytosine-5)-methyltransferase 1
MNNLFYDWSIEKANFTKDKGNVFGTFICGGGSSFGYKLAGFNHLGGVEIDKEVAEIYKENHKPKYLYNMDIRDFNRINELPKDLFDLDILDGSPPCSTFSMVGSRENAWGKEKVFREGQTKQSLDDLVFEYCKTIIRLQPKVFILENVKGIIQGNAKVYSKKIVDLMSKNGYKTQVFLLNSASMGVPQKRERVFFIGHKNVYQFQKLILNFNEKPIVYKQIMDDIKREPLTGKALQLYMKKIHSDNSLGDVSKRLFNNNNYFSGKICKDDSVCNTVVSSHGSFLIKSNIPYLLSDEEIIKIGTFPSDYYFGKIKPKYLIGMSVPPVMTARIAIEIYNQWLSKIK